MQSDLYSVSMRRAQYSYFHASRVSHVVDCWPGDREFMYERLSQHAQHIRVCGCRVCSELAWQPGSLARTFRFFPPLLFGMRVDFVNDDDDGNATWPSVN